MSLELIQNGQNAAIVRENLNAAIEQINELKTPSAGNYRFVDGVLQLYESAPTPGWRVVNMVNGAMQFGELIPLEGEE